VKQASSTNSTDAVQSCTPVSLKRVLAACRCSGVNHCSFRLTSDYPLAEDWGPGVVFIKYACINREFLPEPKTSESPGWESLSLANVPAVRTACYDSASTLRQLLILYKLYWFNVHKIKTKTGVKTNVYLWGFFYVCGTDSVWNTVHLAELCCRTAVLCSGHTIARQTSLFPHTSVTLEKLTIARLPQNSPFLTHTSTYYRACNSRSPNRIPSLQSAYFIQPLIKSVVRPALQPSNSSFFQVLLPTF